MPSTAFQMLVCLCVFQSWAIMKMLRNMLTTIIYVAEIHTLDVHLHLDLGKERVTVLMGVRVKHETYIYTFSRVWGQEAWGETRISMQVSSTWHPRSRHRPAVSKRHCCCWSSGFKHVSTCWYRERIIFMCIDFAFLSMMTNMYVYRVVCQMWLQ